MKNWEHKQHIKAYRQTLEEHAAQKALRHKVKSLKPNEIAILTRIIKFMKQQTPSEDGFFELQLENQVPAQSSHAHSLDDSTTKPDSLPPSGRSETEAIYHSVLSHLMRINVLPEESPTHPRIYPLSEKDGLSLHLRFTPQELKRVCQLMGAEPPLMTCPNRN